MHAGMCLVLEIAFALCVCMCVCFPMVINKLLMLNDTTYIKLNKVNIAFQSL